MQNTHEGMELLEALAVVEALPEHMRATVFLPTGTALQSALLELDVDSGVVPGSDEILAVCCRLIGQLPLILIQVTVHHISLTHASTS